MEREKFIKDLVENLKKNPHTYRKMILKLEKELENVYRTEGRAI